MTELLASDWFVWGVGLILVFQLLVILLGEAIYRADRRTLPIGGIFRALRNIVLPLAVLFVFLTRLLEVERESVPVRLVETALWTSVVYAVLLVVNVLVFENAAEASWRSRAPKLFQDLIRLLLVVIGAAIVLSVVWRQDLGGLIAALGVGLDRARARAAGDARQPDVGHRAVLRTAVFGRRLDLGGRQERPSGADHLALGASAYRGTQPARVTQLGAGARHDHELFAADRRSKCCGCRLALVSMHRRIESRRCWSRSRAKFR